MDADIIKYPLSQPNVILSVSEDGLNPKTGVKVPVSLYTEKFDLTSDLNWTNEEIEPDKGSNAKWNAKEVFTGSFNLYTHQINGLESAAKPLSLAIQGAEGTFARHNGLPGGKMQLYIEDLSQAAVDKLMINAQGGKGWKGITSEEHKAPEDGGDGGHGGQVTVLLGRMFAPAVIMCRTLFDTFGDASKQWPTDFRDMVDAWMDEMTRGEVRKVHPLPATMQDADQILKGTKDAFSQEVLQAYNDLLDPGNELRVSMTTTILTQGGTYGTGGKTANGRGKAGNDGGEGSHTTTIIDASKKMLDISACFVHPVQCQMLLGKAKLLIFLDNTEQRAQALTILQRLQQRLWLLGSPSVPKDLSNTTLGKAYRAAEPNLHIVSGPVDEEPISLRQLRLTRDEVDKTLKQLLAPKIGSQMAKIWVPRGSFAFYQKHADKFLKDLQEVEKSYVGFLKDDITAEQKKQAIERRGSMCDSSKLQTMGLIQVVKLDMNSVAAKISLADQDMKAARVRLLETVKEVEEAVKKAFNFNFDALISAFGQVIFTGGSPWMMANEGAGFAHNSLNKIQNESGVSINKRYLLHSINRINGSIKDLHEGYTI